MPAIYAHDRFGAEAAEGINGELKEIIRRYGRQYRIGLQGPDIFFFYRPWEKNKVNRYGSHLHSVSAYPFFEHALRVVRHTGRDSREYAYLMGFICHFILDSECHSYVAQMIDRTGVQHLEIEEEFEKLLLCMDGRDAVAYRTADLVPADRETAEAIAPFYGKGITPEIVLRSLKDFKMVRRLFTRPGAVSQAAINTVMRLLGKYDKMKGLMNQRRDNPACKESNAGLLQRYRAAIPLAVRMIESFDAVVRTGGKPDLRFDRTFE